MIRKTLEPVVRAGPFGTLVEIAQALACPLDLRTVLKRVLEKLGEDAGILRSAVMILDEENREIHIEVSVGFGQEADSVRFRLGEGITGRVVASGHPVVVPALSREPLFPHPAMRRKRGGSELTFICVPISLDKPLGALAVDLESTRSCDYEGSKRFFTVVASMIAHTLNMHRRIEDERKKLLDENRHLRIELQERFEYSNVIGTGGPMRQVLEQVARVAPTDATVLIRGESGTGKELIAHAIHHSSPRAKEPFVKLCLAALPDTRIESELFGHEEGAFAGTPPVKRGRLELANGGTLFLDDVGELTASTQCKLLRVLQERELERPGGSEKIRLNVRLLAATNKDLEAAVAAEEFREDLYHRLNMFSIFVPALRQRKPDVMLLADHFLAKYSRQYRKSVRRISTPAIDMLMSYRWPGNVRELESTIEDAVVNCESNVIHGHHLPLRLQTVETSGTAFRDSLSCAVEQYEKNLILDALKSARGSCARAARLLDTTERIIGYKVRKYQIDAKRFRTWLGPTQ